MKILFSCKFQKKKILSSDIYKFLHKTLQTVKEQLNNAKHTFSGSYSVISSKLGDWDALRAFNISEQTVLREKKKERRILCLSNGRKRPMLECNWKEFAWRRWKSENSVHYVLSTCNFSMKFTSSLLTWTTKPALSQGSDILEWL